MKLFESGEHYLETILRLKKRQDNVRSIDIANELNYSKASVSRAMNKIKKGGYITINKNGHILFTEKGLLRAHAIYERHRLLTRFLQQTLNISYDLAEKDACRIEHVISQQTFESIKKFLDSELT